MSYRDYLEVIVQDLEKKSIGAVFLIARILYLNDMLFHAGILDDLVTPAFKEHMNYTLGK